MSESSKAAISRISRDRTRAIFQSETGYYVFSLKDGKAVSEPENSLASLVASGGWRRPTSDEEREYFIEDQTEHESLMPTTISEQEAEDILEEELTRGDEDEDPFAILIDDDEPPVGEDEEVYEFNDEYDFYAIPFDNDPNEIYDVYALDPQDEATLYHWENGEFVDASDEEFDSADMTKWVVVDKDTAQYIADWKDHSEDDFCMVHGADPGEKAMFDSAEAEMDWDFIRALGNIVADASGYSSAERSQNAQKQRRGPGGRFARTPGKSPMTKTAEDTSASSIIRTYLPGNFTIKVITNGASAVSNAVAGLAASSGGPSGGITAAGDLVGKEAQEATRPSEEEKQASDTTAYFAVVDKNDEKAVQSLLAITKDDKGVPQAWNRNEGQWKHSPDALADIQSITPPPLVLLDDPAVVKEVLDGIDAFDSGEAPAATDEPPVGGSEAPTDAPVVADAYTSEERSRNALKQRRGPDGRFVLQNTSELHEAIENRNSYVIKTYMPNTVLNETVTNPRQYIEDHFIPVDYDDQEPEHENEAIELAEFSVTQFDGAQLPPDTLFFAIVGKDDNDEIYNMIAFTHDESGIRGWFRNNGSWEQSDDVYYDFVNDTLPNLRLLTPQQADDIAVELDDFDRAAHDMDSFATQSDIQRGYARYDGSFNIQTLDDVYNAVLTCGNNAPDEIKLHIVKRARAFNRMDIVPEQWRSLSYVSQNPLFGEYGEVIVAAGGRRGGNIEDLKRYWSVGKGAAKIRWGTDGDLTRCHKHLTKYIGPQDSWGFCQNLHQRKFGKSNYKRDNG